MLATLACAAMYGATDAPLYNPVGTVDPWLYTALWTNFDQIYHQFVGTYYASRLAWIVPGYALNLLFDQRTAYFVIHIAFFFAGETLLYSLCRRWFGFVPALTAYIALIGNQMYFNEHRWDYETGGTLTFVIASVAFALPKTSSPRRRCVSLALSGFFGAAAVTTLIVDSAFLVVGLPLLYVALLPESDPDSRLRQLALDLGSFVTGALLLVVGAASSRSGTTETSFCSSCRSCEPSSARAARTTSRPSRTGCQDPYFFFPIRRPARGARAGGRAAVSRVDPPAVAGGNGLDRDRLRRDVAGRVRHTGFLFEYTWYFSAFLVPALFTLAAVFAVMLETHRNIRPWAPVIVALGAAAVLATGLWIYRSDSPGRIASHVTDRVYLTALVAMGLALALVALWGALRLSALAAVALALSVFAVTYAADASYGTFVYGSSDRRTGALTRSDRS